MVGFLFDSAEKKFNNLLSKIMLLVNYFRKSTLKLTGIKRKMMPIYNLMVDIKLKLDAN